MKKSHVITLISFVGVLVVTILTTVLIVKHNDSKTVANTQNSNISSSNNSPVANPTYTKFTELAKSKKTSLWFSTSYPRDGITRTTSIDSLFVVRNGKITTYMIDLAQFYGNYDIERKDDKVSRMADKYSNHQLTFAKINKLSDKEIIDKAKKLNREKFEVDKLYFTSPEYQNTVKDNAVQAKYKAPKAQPIKIEAYDDGTSKEVNKEYIVSPRFYDWTVDGKYRIITGDGYTANNEYQGYYEEPTLMMDGDDKLAPYDGVIDDVNYSGWNQYFFTKVKDNQQIVNDDFHDKFVKDHSDDEN